MGIIRVLTAGAACSALAIGLGLASGGESRAASTVPEVGNNSDTFSGYDAGEIAGDVVPRSVSASWIQPKVRVHGYRDAYATIFTGFGDINNSGSLSGLNSKMPEIGTEADSIGGNPQSYAWYTLGRYQADRRIRFSRTVRSGDHITASITCGGPQRDRYTLQLADISPRGRWTQARQVTSQDVQDPTGMSAGVTSPRYGPALLADFSAVSFTKANFNGHVIGSLAPYLGHHDYANPDNEAHILAAAGGLGAAGNSFAVTWHRQK
jgi:hypothetical protein